MSDPIRETGSLPKESGRRRFLSADDDTGTRLPERAAELLRGNIDKESPVPYYYQLREIIRKELAEQRWRVGDLLPSERLFSDSFGVSRPTVRDALNSLVTDGLLRREKGVGTFVAEPRFRERWSGSVVGLSDSLETEGLRLRTEVLNLTVTAPDAQVRAELSMSADEEVIDLRRLRFMGADAVLVTESYLPYALFPGLLDVDFSDKSLYRTLRAMYGTEIVRVKRSLEVQAAGAELAELLAIEIGAPLMYIENTAYTADDRAVEFYVAWRRGDRSRFEFEYSVSGS
jgi:GntR family transcriptional regulator